MRLLSSAVKRKRYFSTFSVFKCRKSWGKKIFHLIYHPLLFESITITQLQKCLQFFQEEVVCAIESLVLCLSWTSTNGTSSETKEPHSFLPVNKWKIKAKCNSSTLHAVSIDTWKSGATYKIIWVDVIMEVDSGFLRLRAGYFSQFLPRNAHPKKEENFSLRKSDTNTR